ncbi:EamA family transporter [Porphyrobacter algicida]|uniref:EamA family transporter n=1 Tax=Qipengyuania algicida TaxID=1836209 RepID=A0A845AG31_9SPHN|nr:EamA family transporter [Qipengyuania algicida]MXP29200.1 EamA family transporter [Qipengyuania algicida]
MSLATIGLLLLVDLLWALNVIVSKLAVGTLGMPPLYYALLRSALVLVALFPLLRPLPQQVWKVMLVGLAIGGGSFALLFIGLATASPSAAGVVGLSGAPLTVLFAILFLGEKVHWRRASGIALTFTGVLLAVSAEGDMRASLGLAFVFASALLGALGSVFYKTIEISSIRLQAWAAVSSIIVLTPLSLVLEPSPMTALSRAPLELAGCLFFASIIVSVGAHSTYYRILQNNDANLVVPLTLLSPLFTIGLGAWLTGDHVGPRLLAGGAIAIAGVAIIVLRPSATFTKRFLVRSRL